MTARLTTIAAGALMAALLAGASCWAASPTPIADIVAFPQTFAGHEVTVVATVTAQTLGFGGQSAYTLQTDDKRLSVISSADAPAPGAQLQVTGTIGLRPADEEFTWPPVLLESARTTP